MNSDQWRRVETLYHAALERENEARLPFLTSTCSDELVRLEVTALLNYDAQAKSFMETPAFKQSTKALAADSDAEAAATMQDIGPYRLLAPIGQGGMGQVYLALDTRLNRKVAIKVLPTAFSSDPERARRFKQEARAASALSHPNIVTVFEVGKTNERHYIVSEFVEGQTLRELLATTKETGLDSRQAIDIAVQVTRALEAAHSAGVIHRDIKPENVMIRKDGIVKVLDFGLAKINTENFPETSSQSQQLLTRTGMVMGTAAYMSPEQARGQQIDHRADIFSLGAMLYECLAGKRPFTGETTSDVIAAVLIKDPEPIIEAAPHIGVPVGAIVMRCLEKRPERRFQSVSDLGFTLQDLTNVAAKTPNTVFARAPFNKHPKVWLAATAFCALIAIALVFVVIKQFGLGSARPTTAFNFDVPTGWSFRLNDAPVISPDGKTIVFSAFPQSDRDGTKSALWIHDVATRESRKIPNTDESISPFWSPDNRYVAFLQGSKLSRLEVATLSVSTLADLAWLGNRPGNASIHGSWGSSNIALISVGWKLYQLSMDGATFSPLEPTLKSENGRSNPEFLSDGHSFVYFSRNDEQEENGIYISAIDSKERKLIVNNGTAAKYANGYLLFSREDQLFAQPFDLSGQKLTGQPVILPAKIGQTFPGPAPVFSASDNGVITWRPQDDNEAAVPPGQFHAQLTWFDTSGRRLGAVGTPGNYSGPSLSADQRRVVVAKVAPRSQSRDLWIIDVVTGASTQFTNDSGDEFNPVWSPDGSWIYFTAARNGTRSVFRKRSEGTDAAEQLTFIKDEENVEDISPDGKFLMINTRDANSDVPDLALIALTGPARRIRLTETSYREDQAVFSPDGKWIAYRAEPPGGSGIVVVGIQPDGRPAGNRFQLTKDGMQPRWNFEGNKLFYMNGDKLISMNVTFDRTNVVGGESTKLFSVKVEPNGRRNRYLLSRDGKFLVVSETEALVGRSVAGQQNWTTALQK